jgi:hypothetical protein
MRYLLASSMGREFGTGLETDWKGIDFERQESWAFNNLNEAWVNKLSTARDLFLLVSP